jgi:D-sedoheptulose 7-phosphate isomerase
MDSFIENYINESKTILDAINKEDIENVVKYLVNVRENGGRLFVLGVGGSCATASHAVNDFRKICQLETYAATDNDSGWEHSFSMWLKGSYLKPQDAILVCSVGGGVASSNVSMNIVNAIKFAKERGVYVLGVVGKNGGYTAEQADACVIIPPLEPSRITAHTEGLCSVIIHLIVSHPLLKIIQTKWESIK